VNGSEALSLSSLVAGVTDGLTGAERAEAKGEVTWARSGRLFAALAGDVLEVRLQEPVVRAALRTPDTSASARGEGWVMFAPATLDRYAADRARAWIESAWRHAAG
jgi:hypothetical protein